MNKPILLITIIITCMVQSALSAQAFLKFKTTENITVAIYKPIDNRSNFSDVVSEELRLKPDLEILYKPDINDFAFVQIAYSTGNKYSLLLLEGDSLEITFDRGNVQFKGSNASGQVYINTFRRYAPVDSIFDKHLNDGIDTRAIFQDINEVFWIVLKNDVEKLTDVNEKFKRIFYKDMEYAVLEMVTTCFDHLLSGRRKVKLSLSDSLIIQNSLDSVYNAVPPGDADILKYRYSSRYMSLYYDLKYRKLSSKEKQDLLQNYSYDTFGPYCYYLLVPRNLQAALFGGILLTQYEYGFGELDKGKLLSFIEAYFPNSEYLSIIKSKYNLSSKVTNAPKQNSHILYIEQSVKKIEDIARLPELRGKRIFVDLWATWCIPCKIEFQFKSKIDSLANLYDISLLYVSIDRKEFINKWKSDVNSLDLKGYHLLANEELIADIKQKFFDNKAISVPHYLLINEKGEIVNKDAPRPSSWGKVDKLFAE